MAEDNEQSAPKHAVPNKNHAPYVRKPAARRNAGVIDDLAEDGNEEVFSHDSGYTGKGSLMEGGAYRRSRSDAKKLRRDLHYGQYLEIPKGRRDIFAKRERATHIKTFFALVAVIAILIVVVYFVWQYMQVNWGATS